ncbi:MULTISPECIES: cytochrome P450 [Pandoraea]|uniref:cytochrome P450 n=1 Tax=Pandoraea TaxID=93217 RepID=UPI001F5D2C65|nr:MULTISPECIES: cytochrome P450 [Pandoraea]MCI3204549.1 cytochrome [Pandoraea sp. LA3]MDN4582577.1 cytochrome [Pandoraea capi]
MSPSLSNLSIEFSTGLPAHPIDAVVHPDPYPYYATLAARRPFGFDASLGMWVAAGPEALAEVLRHPACGVRPAGKVIPPALADGPAGDWFGALVRMNDGAAHGAMKPWLATRLTALRTDRDALARLHDAAQAACADAYLAQGEAPAARLDDFVFRQPVYGLAAWLGVPAAQWTEVYDDVHRLVAAMAESGKPSPNANVLALGHHAATALRQRATRWLDNDAAPGSWLRDTARSAARDDGIDFGVLNANLVGLFTQTHDACAGLVANSIRRLARTAPTGTTGAAADASTGSSASPGSPDLTHAIQIVGDVIRFDPPVQNTRRFLHASAVISGHKLSMGDVILVVLASAPSGPASDDVAWTFGLGAHGCPGRSPASTIAAVGVQAILESGVDLATVADGSAYHSLANARIARFSA